MSNESQDRVQEQAREAIRGSQGQHRGRQFALWMGALIIGAILGWLGIPALNQLFDFIATVFTRLFQFIAVPTIALAVITTLSALGAKKETGRIFAHAVTYTLLTTICAAAIGLVLYLWIAPGNLPVDLINSGVSNVPQKLEKVTYYDHFLSVIPNNMLQPFLSGNVLSVMLIAAAVGLALAFMPKTENRAVLLKGLLGLQEVLFTLIRALLWILPVGILAFSAQLSAQIEAGVIVGTLGKYTLVILGGNLIQFFIVLPIFLVLRGLNPIYVFRKMAPAIAVALFTKSSAGTLPVTLASAEAPQRPSPGIALRPADLHDHQHEWLCRLHPGHIPVPHAERRLRPLHGHHDCLALRRRPGCHRQRRRPHGLLLPDFVAHVRHRCAYRHHGYHPADLHHHRHDRNSRKRLVRLGRLCHDRPRLSF